MTDTRLGFPDVVEAKAGDPLRRLRLGIGVDCFQLLIFGCPITDPGTLGVFSESPERVRATRQYGGHVGNPGVVV